MKFRIKKEFNRSWQQYYFVAQKQRCFLLFKFWAGLNVYGEYGEPFASYAHNKIEDAQDEINLYISTKNIKSEIVKYI